MVKACLLLALLSWGALEAVAAEGKIVVLEAPMFRHPNASSDVVQYVHQGEKVYIHPVVVNDRARFAHIPLSEKARSRRVEDRDPMPLSKDLVDYHDGLGFVLTKDNQGRDAWLKREHVFVFYEDRREFAQQVPRPDPTDYRLLEPLPETFPLVREERLRGNLNLTLGSPYQRNYPYNQKIGAESYGYQLEFNGALMRQLQAFQSGRWYGGGLLTLRTNESRYSLETRKAQETWTRVGIGPAFSYDAWRTDKHRILLTSALLTYPYTQVSITQSERSEGSETRVFTGWNFGGRLGAQWQRVRVLAELDLVLGLWGELESPMQLQAKTATNRSAWWGAGKSDTFNTNTTFALGGSLGLQSTY